MGPRSSRSGGSRPAAKTRPAAKVLTIRAAPSTAPQQAGPSSEASPPSQTPPPGAAPAGDDEPPSIASLTLDTPLRPFAPKRRVPATPFHFLSLPSELRIRIYEYFFHDIAGVLDLAPDNHKRIHGKLRLMRVCRQIHDEATHYFYSTRAFRLFPTHPGRYFKARKPLLARLKPVARAEITSLELRLGPGWSQPPRGWVVNDALGLRDCVRVRRLSVFVECDPSDNIFKGFRRSEGFYEAFSRELLTAVLAEMPAVDSIEFDAWPSVKKSGSMMSMLFDVAKQHEKLICWGPERGWTDDPDQDDHADSGVRFVDGGVSVPGYGNRNVMVLA